MEPHLESRAVVAAAWAAAATAALRQGVGVLEVAACSLAAAVAAVVAVAAFVAAAVAAVASMGSWAPQRPSALAAALLAREAASNEVHRWVLEAASESALSVGFFIEELYIRVSQGLF